MLCAEKFDLFSLNQRDVLTRVITLPKIAVTLNAHATLNRDAFTLALSQSALWADEDSFEDHFVLLIE